MSSDRPICLHCQKRQAKRPRQLCWPCHKNPEIRRLYKPVSVHGEYGAKGYEEHKMTAEEVEALIAEQSKPENLPPWWPKHGVDVAGFKGERDPNGP